MSERISCTVEDVVVRDDKRPTVQDLIFKLFQRRNHRYVGGQEKDWLTVELVQSLRKQSRVYREELSTEMSGPLPFALGYFQLDGDTLRLTTDRIPARMEPIAFVRFLSEFVEPGATVWMGTGEERRGWRIDGVDVLTELE